MNLRFLAGSIAGMSYLLLTGCSTPTATRSPTEVDAGNPRDPSKPDLLYLLATPHPRLYVEVDSVKGSEPKEVALLQLRGFLSAYCNKPDGIEIVRSDVIPVAAARGVSARALARRYLNGPDKTNAPPAAFLYLLYYDDGLSRYSAITRFLHRGSNPYAETYPYPAVYFNTRYSLGIAMNEILLHEVGHLLGMVSRTNHARAGHCRNSGCQMNRGRDYLLQFRWLPGRRQSGLCAECVAELKQRSTEPPSPKLRYVGPVLVRSEVDYHVAGLPFRAGVIVGSFTDEDCSEFALAVRAEPAGPVDAGKVYCWVTDDALKDPGRLKDTLNRVRKDPSELVRSAAPKALFQACAGQYGALGQYSNAVEILKLAILSDSKADWGYNQLAWIRATCSDVSIRNGEEAVSAANKACELTHWKNGMFIDTLAAACAEAGDFKRAVELQEKALNIGNPTGSDQSEMQERLSLYRQSQPFREKPQ